MKVQTNLSGLGVNLVTPFNQSGEIDFPALEKLVNRLGDSKIDFILVNGSAAEASLLSFDEQDRVLAFVAEINDARVDLVCGISGADTRTSVQRVSKMLQSGYVALYADEPLPRASSSSGFVGHFRSIAQATELPLIIQHRSPLKDGRSIEGILQLLNEPGIIGVVESTGDVALSGEIIRNKPRGTNIFCGRDVMNLPLMALGCDGVVSTIANAFSDDWSNMLGQMQFGNFQDARSTHHQFAPLLRILETEGEPTGIKAILNHFQKMEHTVRLPNTPVSEEVKSLIYKELAHLPQESVELLLG
ncbi:MAG: dihydrodipicolinate synthase family protein [Bacteroidetes bacterium]|nr:dihydrodipicolinate synthase family protein [Bacteroidota bacterium]MDA1335942.1 dihydrodipicolinate synthase family protein [Bacteroidota bacterium]